MITIEKLPAGSTAADLGEVFQLDSLKIVCDLSSPIVAGTCLNAALFGAPPDSQVEWTQDPDASVGGPGLLVTTGPYMAWNIATPGTKTLQGRIASGGDAVLFAFKVQVLEARPRIQFQASGTPESDPLSLMRFVHAYHHYIVKAAQATGWPAPEQNGICPRLIAAIVYRDYLRTYLRTFAAQDNPVHQDRIFFGARLECVTPSQLADTELWQTQLGICGLPLCLIEIARSSQASVQTMLQEAVTAIYTSTWSRQSASGWLDKLIGGDQHLDETIAWLANLARFPKPNIRYTALLLKLLRDCDVQASVATDPDRMVGLWPGLKNRALDESQLGPINTELPYLLAAYDRMRQLGTVRKLEATSYAREVLQLASLPAMDLYFNIETDYGGYTLQRGDSDDNQTYGGQTQIIAPATHIQTLVADLRHLGIAIAGKQLNGVGAGQTVNEATHQFLAPTEWAVREFQIAAGMDNLGYIRDAASDHYPSAMPDTDHNYESRLAPVDNPIHYTGPISGFANLDTRSLIQYWKRNRLRYPIVIGAWTSDGTSLWPSAKPKLQRVNLWFRRDETSTDPRMFARDITAYYQFNPTGVQTSVQGGLVLGTYEAGYEGGPYASPGEASAQKGHSWPGMQITWESLLSETAPSVVAPATKVTPTALTQTFNVIYRVGIVEAGGRFDSLNGWDSGIISWGPYQWTISGGELGAYFAFLIDQARSEEDRRQVAQLFARFGLDFPSWNGTGKDLLVPEGARKYTAVPRLQKEDDTFLEIALGNLQQELEYFRTWPWFYRFSMAAHTSDFFRRGAWDMARIRIRDILSTPIGDNLTNGPSAATFGDVFTSELAVAIVLRWHVNMPIRVIKRNTGAPELLAALTQARQVVPGIKNENNVANWNFGAQDENVFFTAFVNYFNSQAGTGWANLVDTVNKLKNKSDYLEDTLHLDKLSSQRNSFELYDTGLPPSPF